MEKQELCQRAGAVRALVAGGIGAGLVVDVSSAGRAIWLVAAATAASGLWVALTD